ncbi:MAG: transketolase [Verrucomicrobiota bacterium]|jgi:transketolase
MSNAALTELASHIRCLSAEAVQKANSGHPGLPMGCADIAAVLFSEFLTFDPAHPHWIGRDRFVLSAGHGSMLQYSLLHLFGYAVSMEDLKNFRQLGAPTAGHPEFGHIVGVETTTGPLGAGISNAVGMALSAKMLGARFGQAQVPSKIYALCGDGCMMEGVAAEASSTAGHLQLDNLVIIYDSNRITIEGSTDIAFTEDVAKRYEAYGFAVLKADGHSMDSVRAALKASQTTGKPTLIIATTTIGKGSPNKSGTHKVHGAPLGPEETGLTRAALLPGTAEFTVTAGTAAFCKEVAAKGAAKRLAWEKAHSAWAISNPELKAKWDLFFAQTLPHLTLPEYKVGESIASRASSEKTLNAIADQVEFLVGGSADLDCSNLTRMKDKGDVNTGAFAGRNLHFGVREHSMGGIVNGMALFGGLRPYCATFLVFADYMRPTIRLAALMKIPVIYVFTHDSFFVGEDGPTHQPTETKAGLECIPGLTVYRPADANEVNASWIAALKNTSGPTALLMSRQNLVTLQESVGQDVTKGAYVAKKEAGAKADLIIMASGSEVKHALDTAAELEKDGKSVRVVSMPSAAQFEKQSAEYKKSVLPCDVRKRFAIDYGSSYSWHRYAGIDGLYACVDTFGECGPGPKVAEHLGFTTAKLAEKARGYLKA